MQKDYLKGFKKHPLFDKLPFDYFGLGGSTPGQDFVQSGPTIEAANSAALSQEQAARMAAQESQQGTTEAINALMGQYANTVGLLNPEIQTGNQAAAQLNYMLGLPAVSPGAAPVAPTITSSDLIDYVNSNSSLAAGNMIDYGGVGAVDNHTLPGMVQGDNGGDYAHNAYEFLGPSNTRNALGNQIAAAIQQDPTLSLNYNTELQQYNQQQNTWNQANNIYQTYQAKGQATPYDIGAIVNNLPGFQFQQQQGLSQIQNAASANGSLNSGNLLMALDQFGQGLSSTYYNNYLNSLQGLAGIGANATSNAANASNQLGNNLAGSLTNNATNVANSYLAAGQAQASAYLSPLANQDTRITQVGGGGGELSGVGGLLSGVASLAGAFGGL